MLMPMVCAGHVIVFVFSFGMICLNKDEPKKKTKIKRIEKDGEDEEVIYLSNESNYILAG